MAKKKTTVYGQNSAQLISPVNGIKFSGRSTCMYKVTFDIVCESSAANSEKKIKDAQ